jgi:uncharacterized protein (DUF2235 family)
MLKNIVVCCDGTGNEFRESRRNTNVVKLFEVIVKTPTRQIAYYDPGVGTMSLPGFVTWAGKWTSIVMGLAFGYGITRNIEDAYSYLMARHVAGDRLYIFGFSRGAFTARALAGMLHVCGLLEKGSDNLIPYASKVYMRARREPRIAADFKKTFSRECKPHFIGVWDTVESVGIVPGFRRRFPDTRLNGDVLFGRHALALDERRSQFRPNPWTEPAQPGQSIVQVWFPGVHADVGGSYPEAGLSNIALRWMLKAAADEGLVVDETAAAQYLGDDTDALHNPLLPFWWLLGWGRRRVPEGALVHRSVIDRKQHLSGYDPPNLPARFTKV